MPRHYPSAFRREVCERMLAGESVRFLAAELHVGEDTLYRWKRQALIDAGSTPGVKSVEVDELAQALQTIEERTACRIAGVSRSSYYEHKFHLPSDREIRRLVVTDLVADVHARSRGTYGMLRIRGALLNERGMVVNKKLILSIMRELGIKGLPGPAKHKKNLVNAATEQDLVQRNSPQTVL